MDALSHAQILIAKASISPNDAGAQCYLATQLEAVGFSIHRFDQGDTSNMLAVYGEKKPSILFVGHTDVVPEGPLASWSSPPFQPTIVNNRLVGRGAVDMKGAIAAMLAAQLRLLAKKTIQGSLAWLITSDEEASGVDGIKATIPKLKAKGHHFNYAIVGEPASHKTIGDTLKIGRRGSLHATLRIQGKQGHVAYPDEAQNPHPILIRCLQKLLDQTWDQTATAPFPPTSLQITNLTSSSNASNVIPEYAEARINFRFPPTTPHTQLQAMTNQCLKNMPVSIDWHLSAEPYYAPEGHLVKMAKKCLIEHGVASVKITTSGGTSDGRFLAPICDEIIEMGACYGQAHQCNESIALDELETLSHLYEQLLRNLLH